MTERTRRVVTTLGALVVCFPGMGVCIVSSANAAAPPVFASCPPSTQAGLKERRPASSDSADDRHRKRLELQRFAYDEAQNGDCRALAHAMIADHVLGSSEQTSAAGKSFRSASRVAVSEQTVRAMSAKAAQYDPQGELLSATSSGASERARTETSGSRGSAMPYRLGKCPTDVQATLNRWSRSANDTEGQTQDKKLELQRFAFDETRHGDCRANAHVLIADHVLGTTGDRIAAGKSYRSASRVAVSPETAKLWASKADEYDPSGAASAYAGTSARPAPAGARVASGTTLSTEPLPGPTSIPMVFEKLSGTYVGDVQNGQAHGNGTFTWRYQNVEKTFSGQWLNGVAHGVLVVEGTASGKALNREEFTYINGVKHGPAREYGKSGTVVEAGQYSDGRPEGEWIHYFESGKPYMRMVWANGAIVRSETIRDEDPSDYSRNQNSIAQLGSAIWGAAVQAENQRRQQRSASTYTPPPPPAPRYDRPAPPLANAPSSDSSAPASGRDLNSSLPGEYAPLQNCIGGSKPYPRNDRAWADIRNLCNRELFVHYQSFHGSGQSTIDTAHVSAERDHTIEVPLANLKYSPDYTRVWVCYSGDNLRQSGNGRYACIPRGAANSQSVK